CGLRAHIDSICLSAIKAHRHDGQRAASCKYPRTRPFSISRICEFCSLDLVDRRAGMQGDRPERPFANVCSFPYIGRICDLQPADDHGKVAAADPLSGLYWELRRGIGSNVCDRHSLEKEV